MWQEGPQHISKLNLPGGLSNSIQQKILNEKFGAFDSFDGAYFNVNGSEIFSGNKNNTNKIAYQTNNIINNYVSDDIKRKRLPC